MSFANSGGIGQQTSLFIRGANSSHTLVLIDGARIGSVGNGLPAFEQLPVEQIERIEIVRVPRSSLYGADAIGGVVQVFARHGSRDGGLLPSFSVTTGSDNLLRGHAGLAGDHAWYNLSVGAQHTRGINACRIGAAEAFAGCFTDEPDRDADSNRNLSANGGYRRDNGEQLTGSCDKHWKIRTYSGHPPKTKSTAVRRKVHTGPACFAGATAVATCAAAHGPARLCIEPPATPRCCGPLPRPSRLKWLPRHLGDGQKLVQTFPEPGARRAGARQRASACGWTSGTYKGSRQLA